MHEKTRKNYFLYLNKYYGSRLKYKEIYFLDCEDNGMDDAYTWILGQGKYVVNLAC